MPLNGTYLVIGMISVGSIPSWYLVWKWKSWQPFVSRVVHKHTMLIFRMCSI